ncbi:MAG: nitroreductase family protein [Thiobacillaceae bacterium]
MQWPSTGSNVFETILARRSVRNYQDQDIDRETVRTLLDAAVRAPTAIHEEPWAFVIVQNRALLHQLSEYAKPLIAKEAQRTGHAHDVFTSPDFNIFYNAGTLIVICAKPIGHFVAADCWLAAENLMLAACAMGLGSCVIGSALTALDIPEIKNQLGIPPEFSAIAPIIVGHPRGETPVTSRREPFIVSWHE